MGFSNYFQGKCSKDDICLIATIIAMTSLAIIVTIIKIILFDVKNYPSLFGKYSEPEPEEDNGLVSFSE